MLAAAGKQGAFQKVRQPVLPEGVSQPLVLASGLLKVVWEARVHEEAVTGLAVLRNPHMPETILSCGFDQCVRASDSSDGNLIGRLCQKLTSTSVNPHWNMVVDAESWRSKASAVAEAAIQAADAEVKKSMDVRSGAPRPARARSRTVAMVTDHDWSAELSGLDEGSAAHREERSPEAELFSRAAAAVPPPKELRFSQKREQTGPAASSRARVAMALRQAMEDADDEDAPSGARSRR